MSESRDMAASCIQKRPFHLALIALIAVCSNLVHATPREDVLAALSSLQASGDLGLEARLEGLPEALPVGSPIELRLSTSKPAYLSFVYVDAHGVISAGAPVIGPAGNLMTANTQYLLPGEDTKMPLLQARLPEGQGDLFVIASAKPRTAPSGKPGPEVMIASTESPEFARALVQELRDAGTEWQVQRLPLRVRARSGAGEYSVQEIVQYFTETTRSIEQPRLDVYVNFRFNSAEITPDSLPRMQTWGKVLSDPLMRNQRFIIGGHTDDVGSEEYNMELSLRRAQAVRDMLVSQYGISPSRLEVRGYGKTRPLISGTSEADRQANRRVDFTRDTTQ